MTQLSAVIYNGKKLIPAPLITLNRVIHRSEDGGGVGETIGLTLTGKLVACRGGLYDGAGYPADSFDCCQFQDILDKQQEIRQFFDIGDNDYKWFEIQSYEPDGASSTPPKKWRTRVKDVNFKEGLWVQSCDYTIQLECLNDEDTACDIAHSDKWDVQFQADNGCVYTVTRNLSCHAKDFVNESGDIDDGAIQAQKWVDRKIDEQDEPGDIGVFLGLDAGYVAYNKTTTKNIDHTGGTYGFTQTWLLAKNPVVYNASINSDSPRDGDYTVKVHGSFKSFINDASDNGSAAYSAFLAWDASHEPFNLANAAYTGSKTLNNCSLSKSVTQTIQKRGDGTQVFCAETVRVVEFSYDFSDGGDPTCDSDITVSEHISNTGECGHTVSVGGSIQGHKCGGSGLTTQIDNASSCYNALNLLTLATAGYTGSKIPLRMISKEVSKDTRKGVLTFRAEYDDKFSAGYKKEESLTESWECENRGSDGKALKTLAVEGSLTGLCDIAFSALVAAIPTADSFNTFGGYITRNSISKDEINHKVSYHYTVSEDSGKGKTDINTTTKKGPEKCLYTYTSLQISVTGNGCTNELATTNAKELFYAIDLSSLVPTNTFKTSSSVSIDNHGKVTGNYEYSDAGEAETDITIVESWDANDCGIKHTQVQGRIKGACGANGGAMAAAARAYAQIDYKTFCSTGYIVSKSKTHNDVEGSISFQFECQDRPHNYIEEKSISTKYDVEQSYTTVGIEGSITPLCISDMAAQVIAGQVAWDTIKGGLEDIAKGACGGGKITVLKRSSVSISQINGKVSYNYEYGCLPCQRVAGTIEESIDISFNKGGDVIAIIPIPGRTCGPLIQDKKTKKESTFTVNVSLKFKPNCCDLSKPAGIEDAITSIINSANACPSNTVNTYTTVDNETWNPCTGRYTRQITKLCECC